uniref:Nucleoside-diphosphate-sugar epimerase n=1 Tax=Aureimonas frigidaquae TaxID=424757 RepID=A0A0P0Z180_9HYPH|nr:nucleoside-diphosphate-sugar epimerase [Aureimonas frigidaquae]
MAAFEAELDAAFGHQRTHAIAEKFRCFAAAPDAANAVLVSSFQTVHALAGFTPIRTESRAGRHRAILTSAPSAYGIKKARGAWKRRGLVLARSASRGPCAYSASSVRFFIAAARMSPSEAPESDEPY